MSTSPPLHPSLGHLGWLVGTWEGTGNGDYPTIEPFEYAEQVTITHTGRPFLTYHQRTWDRNRTQPLHTESGYLRPGAGPEGVEFLVVQPTGLAEVSEGSVRDGVLAVVTSSVARTSTAKDVRSVRRRLWLDDDELCYELWMAYAEVPDTVHLEARLRRT